jgi:uncharacterized protein (TIGR02391 family)
VSGLDSLQFAIGMGHRITRDLAGLAVAVNSATASPVGAEEEEDRPAVPGAPAAGRHAPVGELLAEYDHRIRNPELRAATRSRFESRHYADAVEAGVKALNECIRARTGRTEDGDGLMTLVFSPAKPLLRTNKLRSKADESAQRGHMQLCQGVVAAWRNPRAHTLTDDDPARCLMMLEVIGDLIETTRQAIRTRHHH